MEGLNVREVPIVNSMFLTPGVKNNSFEIDHDGLMNRMDKVATIGLCAIALLAIVFITVFPLSMATFAIGLTLATAVATFFGFQTIDKIKANQVADRAALQEYLKEEAPSSLAHRRLVTSYPALKSLISQKGDLDKRDIEGKTLLDHLSLIMEDRKPEEVFAFFKLLVDKGATVSTDSAQGKAFFTKAVSSENPLYLTYLLEKNKASREHFTDEEKEALIRALFCRENKIQLREFLKQDTRLEEA